MSQTPTVTPGNRSWPALGFLLALLGLAAIALGTLRAPPRIITGLPDDPAVARMRASLANRLRVDTGELRMQAALLGDEGEMNPSLAERGAAMVTEAIGHRPRDPRLRAALAFVDLAGSRLTEAERNYRKAIDLAPTYGEARLGLGMTIAMQAAEEPDDERARGLRLRAISQFASVPDADPCYLTAVYDRALLLARVGRMDEAQQWARAYFAREPRSPWSAMLMREIPGAQP